MLDFAIGRLRPQSMFFIVLTRDNRASPARLKGLWLQLLAGSLRGVLLWPVTLGGSDPCGVGWPSSGPALLVDPLPNPFGLGCSPALALLPAVINAVMRILKAEFPSGQ